MGIDGDSHYLLFTLLIHYMYARGRFSIKCMQAPDCTDCLKSQQDTVYSATINSLFLLAVSKAFIEFTSPFPWIIKTFADAETKEQPTESKRKEFILL